MRLGAILLAALLATLSLAQEASIDPHTGTITLSFFVTGTTIGDFAASKANAACVVVARLAAESPANCVINSATEAAGSALTVQLGLNSERPESAYGNLLGAAGNGTLSQALSNAGVQVEQGGSNITVHCVAAKPAGPDYIVVGAAAHRGGSDYAASQRAAAVIVGAALGGLALLGLAGMAVFMAARHRQGYDQAEAASPEATPRPPGLQACTGSSPAVAQDSVRIPASGVQPGKPGQAFTLPNTFYLVAAGASNGQQGTSDSNNETAGHEGL